jgi:hypothetical protein
MIFSYSFQAYLGQNVIASSCRWMEAIRHIWRILQAYGYRVSSQVGDRSILPASNVLAVRKLSHSKDASEE